MSGKFHAPEGAHPAEARAHLSVWRLLPALLLAMAFAGGTPATSRAAEQKTRPSKLSFLIFGTVFDERGFALPGAEILARRAGEKKVRGEAYSDRRGEFGIRVPLDFEYEVQVKIKGFEEQRQKVDAREGNRKDLVFRMKPKGEKKK